MDRFGQTLADFGRRLGMDRLPVGPGGAASLDIERIGRLDLESDGERVFVTLARPVPPSLRPAEAALALAHWRENHPWPVHAGMRGGEWLAFTAVLPETEFDVPALERALPYLSGLLDASLE